MRIAKFQDAVGGEAIGLVSEAAIRRLARKHGPAVSLAEILEADDPFALVHELAAGAAAPIPLDQVKLLAPIDRQEVWAAGVTYQRSKTARMEESEAAASCYDRVYASARPELFFKAAPHRVVGPGAAVRIRQDSKWNVPEPELTLVLNSRMQLVGFTIGNDMSSRDIEGDNPLYLPQAKVYDACCSLGPWIVLNEPGVMDPNATIELSIRRQDTLVFEGETGIDRMARSFDELIGWLARDNSFPNGAFLLTGTGIVPESQFTLQPGDVIEITIDGVGALSNYVVQGQLAE